jgi:hypothetical protein
MNNNLKGQQIQFAKAISGTKFQLMNQCKDSSGAPIHTMKNAVGSRTIEEIDRILPMRLKYRVVRRAKGVGVYCKPQDIVEGVKTYITSILSEAGMSNQRIHDLMDYISSNELEGLCDIFPLLNVTYFALLAGKKVVSDAASQYILNEVSFDLIDSEARSFIAAITLYKLNEEMIDSEPRYNKADLIIIKTLANAKFSGKIAVESPWDVYSLGGVLYFEDYLQWLKGSGF